jgi:hypothetical protein
VVELKHGSFKPEYKGQMELYLRWLAQNEPEPDQNLPLGIILCAGKNTEQIELLELGTTGIHVVEYLTVLPPAEVLREKLHQAIETARARIEAKAGRSERNLISVTLKPVVRFWNATPQPSVATRERWAAIGSGSASVRSRMTRQRIDGSESRSHLTWATRGT